MRERLGDGYTEAVRCAHVTVSESVDFVMYWWWTAAKALATGTTRRFGFITTNSITQTFNRSVIDGANCAIAFAIPDHPWVDGNDGAAVRIAMSAAEQSSKLPRLQLVTAEGELPEGFGERWVQFEDVKTDVINSDLSGGADVTKARSLKSNDGLAVQGMNPLGLGFRLRRDDLARLGIDPADPPDTLRRYLIGRDLVQRPEEKWVVDFYGLTERESADSSPQLYQYILQTVKPERDQNRRPTRRQNWWLFGENAPALRRAMVGLNRVVATCRTSKHRLFSFVPSNIVVDAKVVAIALDDAFYLGLLSSRPHVTWAVRTGGWLGIGNDSNYNHSDCFAKFPFPAQVPEPVKIRIRTEAEALDTLRKRILTDHPDLTLTGLYNVLGALRDGRQLTPEQRDIHDRGLVTLIRQHHDAIDKAVAEAYAWPADLDEEDILIRLIALNKQRAAEEAAGHVRWLRPEFQAPTAAAMLSGALDLGDAQNAPVGGTILLWPKLLPDQVSAVAQLLAGAGAPLSSSDVARAFAAKRQASVTPVLDALAAIGQARRLEDGRYAA